MGWPYGLSWRLKCIWICARANPKQALGHPGNQVSLMCPYWEYCCMLLRELHRRIGKSMQVTNNLDFHSYHHSWYLSISIFKNDRFCCLALCMYFTFLSEINMLKKTYIAYNYYYIILKFWVKFFISWWVSGAQNWINLSLCHFVWYHHWSIEGILHFILYFFECGIIYIYIAYTMPFYS